MATALKSCPSSEAVCLRASQTSFLDLHYAPPRSTWARRGRLTYGQVEKLQSLPAGVGAADAPVTSFLEVLTFRTVPLLMATSALMSFLLLLLSFMPALPAPFHTPTSSGSVLLDFVMRELSHIACIPPKLPEDHIAFNCFFFLSGNTHLSYQTSK